MAGLRTDIRSCIDTSKVQILEEMTNRLELESERREALRQEIRAEVQAIMSERLMHP